MKEHVLHLIAQLPCLVPIAKILLQKGANLEATDSRGYTPLFASIAHKNVIMCEFFLQICKHQYRSGKGLTPLNFFIFTLAG